MLAKDMHFFFLQTEFKNCIFSTFEGKFPLSHPIFFNGQKFIMPNKDIKTRKLGPGGIDMKIANILLKMNNGFQ